MWLKIVEEKKEIYSLHLNLYFPSNINYCNFLTSTSSTSSNWLIKRGNMISLLVYNQ